MAATQLSTSNMPVPPTNEEVQEYEKILKISDDIFSGAHPRLKVPQQFVRKPASRNPPSAPQVKSTGGASESSPTNLPPSVSSPNRGATSQNAQAIHAAVAANSTARIVPKPTSEIDPIFLTKSDDLVRAELQLHRQRVERALREQLEQKRQESKQKAWVQDTKPDFDVSEVLNKAFEMVKPSPSVDGPGAGEPSDSFDDNSFYSSRAPDSPQHGDPQQQPSPAPPFNRGELAAAAPKENLSDELQRLEALNRTESDQELQNTYPVADQRLPYPQRRSRMGPDHEASDHYEPAPPADALEEPEYSPPAPGVAPMAKVDGNEVHRGYPNGQKRRPVDGRLPDRPRYARRSPSAGDDVRIVRNHITSPAAPQPSRVSPLAVTKVASVRQPREIRSEYESERQGSPDAAPQQLMSRKRRRVHDERDRARPASYRMQGTGLDEPYIKEEPVSPPPFADDPQISRTRQPQERPIYIDIASPRYTPVMERREPPVRAYDLDPYEYPVDTGLPRTVSRLSVRRPARDDQDLRRVASLHQARQSEYPRELIEQTSPRSVRAGSYAYVERAPQERVRYYEEPPPPPATRRYVPADESPPSSRYRETYYEEAPSRMMAPPPRRIVVDEHGNEYYEVAPAPRVQMMPPPSGRVPIPRSEVYDDPGLVRHASVRAASVVEDPYGTRHVVQEVPPQTTYRRVTDYARPIAGERRSYAAPVAEPFQRSSSVHVAGYSARQPTYVEEAEYPREHLVRMPSTRPPDEPAYPHLVRMPSVRPVDEAKYPRERLVRVPSVRPTEEANFPREHLVRMPSTRPPDEAVYPHVIRMPSTRPQTARYEEPHEMIPRVESVRPPGGHEVSVYMEDDPRRPREYVERPVYVATRPLPREERYYDNGEAERMVLDDGVRRVSQRY